MCVCVCVCVCVYMSLETLSALRARVERQWFFIALSVLSWCWFRT